MCADATGRPLLVQRRPCELELALVLRSCGLMMIPQKVMEQPLVTPGTTVEGVLLPLSPGSAAGRFAFFLNFLAAVTAAWLKRPRFLFFDDAMAAWCS